MAQLNSSMVSLQADFGMQLSALRTEMARERERRTSMEATLGWQAERLTSLEAELLRERERRIELEAEVRVVVECSAVLKCHAVRVVLAGELF